MSAYAANLYKKGFAEGYAEGRAEGEAKKEAEILQKLLESKQPKEFILGLGFTENEYQKAEKAFSEKAASPEQ